jgi:hypothetical protein
VGVAGQHGPGGCLGVDRVVLALAASVAAKDAVARWRPSRSSRTATWTSLWVSIPSMSCGGWAIEAIPPEVEPARLCQAVGDGQDTHGAQQLNALLGHDPNAWKHVGAHRPGGRQFKLRATRASRSEGQTNESTRTTGIID